ncbi:MAG: acyl-CoA dehydrogenase [Firmicutes bacterium]|nr:acyl-CoA dehydrogenase [Bacillota bacterium]
MDFSLTQEQQDFSRMVENFAKNEIAPLTLEMDEKQEWLPRSVYKKMAGLGLCGVYYPEEYGGLGLGATDTLVAMEAACRGGACAGSVISWGTNLTIGSLGIVKFGTEEQKSRYLPGIASGDLITCFALTEPGAGSDASGIRMRAEKKGDHYVLNGTKLFITNGPICDMGIVFAVTDPSRGALGISAFIFEKGFPGFSRGNKLNKMGMRSSPTGELVFEDCIVPAENLLAKEGEGFTKVAHGTLEWERCVFGYYLGLMEYNLNLCIDYVKTREQFGQPIGNFQAMRHRIAEMRTELDAARFLMYRIAWMIDNRMTPAPVEASIGKSFLGTVAKKNAEYAVHIFGGYGYCKEYIVERSYRDVKLIDIGGGTLEIQRDIIAQGLLGRPAKPKKS